MSKTVAIAGMGWLGQALAYRLQTFGYNVKASVTTAEKLDKLKKSGYDVYRLELSEDGISGDPVNFLKNADYLVVMIPPGLRRSTGADYTLKMSHFFVEIEGAGIPKIIFISSTSVYDDSQGRVTEKDVPQPKTNAGRQLLEVEQLFTSFRNARTTIIRFGGLFGGSRQPVRYLAGRAGLRGGKAPVNLVHRDDAVGIIMEVIRQDALGGVFNVAMPNHPTKESYYTKMAKALQLEPPKFLEEGSEVMYKMVESENLESVLGYTFKHNL